MYIEPGLFQADSGMEEVSLSGNYDIKKICNDDLSVSHMNETIHCQSVYLKGNVFYRTDTENINDLIKLFIRYTHDPCKDLESEFDFSIKSIKQMMGGTICPTKKTLFVYKNKVFVAFGRYIFRYNKTYAKLKREIEIFQDVGNVNVFSDENSESDSDSEEEDENDGNSHTYCFNSTIRKSSITSNAVILGIPETEKDLDDYVYSFMIYDHANGILDAFGLYR